MYDEFRRRLTKTETERGGSGRSGGRPRTAIGLTGDGDSDERGGVTQPRVAITHSDAEVEFALNCALQPLAESGAIKISEETIFDLEHRRLRKGRRADIVICEPDLAAIKPAFSQSTSYHPRVIAVVPAHIAAEYFNRFNRNGINICLLKFGFEAVVRTTQSVLAQTGSTIINDYKVQNFFSHKFKIKSLTSSQHELLCRLQFARQILLAEFDVSEKKLDSMKEDLYKALNVPDASGALKIADSRGIIQLTTQPDPVEAKIFKQETLKIITSWFEKELTGVD